MKCPACGNENQPAAKFCVHCGIVLGTPSAPAWTAVPAGSASAPAPRPAVPVQPTPTPAPSVARPAAATGPAPAPAAEAAAAAPEATRKAGLMIAVIALLIVFGAGGYFGYRMLSGEGKETVAVVEPPRPAEAPPPPVAPATDKPATQDAASTAAPAASPSTAAPGPATGVEPTRSVAPAPTGVPLPGRPPIAAEGTKTDSGQMKAVPSKAPPKGAPSGAEAPPKVAPPPKGASPPVAPSPAPSKAAAKAPAPAPDRWQVMAEAMAQCAQAPFFSRIACEQRTRNRYCEGYWGQVAQCPSAPTRDHGQ